MAIITKPKQTERERNEREEHPPTIKKMAHY